MSEDYDLGLEEIVDIAMREMWSQDTYNLYRWELQQSEDRDPIWTQSTKWLRDLKSDLLNQLDFWLYITEEEVAHMGDLLAPLASVFRRSRSAAKSEALTNAYRRPGGLWALNEHEYNNDFIMVDDDNCDDLEDQAIEGESPEQPMDTAFYSDNSRSDNSSDMETEYFTPPRDEDSDA